MSKHTSTETGHLLDGKKLANQIKQEISEEVRRMVSLGSKCPHLAAILVGDDGASQTYVNHKVSACKQVGFESSLIRLESTISEERLIEEVISLNENPLIDGFIVQLPLPKHISPNTIIESISPEKDVDGFHPVNVGRMTLNLPTFISATPYGIMQLLERNKIKTEGKHCVVVGRSNIVGTPMSILLSRSSSPGNCTVTLCHSRTKNLVDHIQQADILIVALGKPAFVTGDMVKDGVVVIDVGITRVADKNAKRGYTLKGDVHFESVSQKASYITPVPGGVGPMTVTSLLLNTLKAAQRNKAIHI